MVRNQHRQPMFDDGGTEERDAVRFAGPSSRECGRRRGREGAPGPTCTCTGVWRTSRDRRAARAPGRDCAFGAYAGATVSGRSRRARGSIRNAASRAALPSLVRKPDCVGSAPAPLSKPRPRAQPPHLRRGSETRARAAAKSAGSAGEAPHALGSLAVAAWLHSRSRAGTAESAQAALPPQPSV
jgi:hypothetical protein